jgi:hypothetical protein
MSWSLTLSPRLSPAVLLGVSRETPRTTVAPLPTGAGFVGQPSRHLSTPSHDFPKQVSVPCGALLALGVRAQLEELPITAA